MKKYERENASDTSNLKKYESEVEKAAKSLENLGYQEGSYEEAERRLRDTDHELRSAPPTTRLLYVVYSLIVYYQLFLAYISRAQVTPNKRRIFWG